METDISDKPAEDITIKKLIANVNFGLLEKNTNKAHTKRIYIYIHQRIIITTP